MGAIGEASYAESGKNGAGAAYAALRQMAPAKMLAVEQTILSIRRLSIVCSHPIKRTSGIIG